MFDLTIYMDNKVSHYVKVDEETLERFRAEIDDGISPDFIEIYCHDAKCTFAINRGKVNAYSYKLSDRGNDE